MLTRSISRGICQRHRCYSECLIRETEGNVYEIILNRPEKRNALGKSLVDALRKNVETIPPTARLAIFKSSAPGAFCAGADLIVQASTNGQVGESGHE